MNIIDDAFHRPAFGCLDGSESIRDAPIFVHKAGRNRQYKLNTFG
jgi:hypothetical protein